MTHLFTKLRQWELRRIQMEEFEVRAQVSTGNHVLKEWRLLHSPSLPALITSVAHLKASLNEFLVSLQNQRGSATVAQEDGLVNYNESFEDDEEQEDLLSGALHALRSLKEPLKSIKKQNEEGRYCQEAKKMKK